MRIKAVYEGGVFRPLEPLDLQEGTEVLILIPDEALLSAGHLGCGPDVRAEGEHE